MPLFPRSYLLAPSLSYVIALVSMLSLTSGHAAEIGSAERARQFVIDRYQDGRHLIEGPAAIAPPVIDTRLTCVELYQRRLVLLRQMQHHKPAYWDDPRNQAAVFIGLIWTPAFYFLSYSALTARLDDLSMGDPQIALDTLRHASAQQRCFEK